MRTTIVIDDQILRLAKKRAAEAGSTLSKVVEDTLRSSLVPRPAASRPSYRLKWPALQGRVLPGVDVADRDALYDRMEGRA